ncbi:Crp/Fnr family transcriptional regulator [Microlunatus parietis]|uniref:CRP-like cAMP-binding protein n=1 Tax=Microlunatus parietis TaxID=682979 RepID=A0A7Y9I4V5_9ACTN|nr:Crp/Fnr family transcriptional regulator [Microlunatus parietis]NYE70071.1 CRP-like cAMP-binding protein [Microlunatus parietis]
MISRVLPRLGPDPAMLRAAAWIARCVGRGENAPLRPEDLDALATYLDVREFPAGAVLFAHGQPLDGVWILRHGSVELAVGTGRRHAVIGLMHPGDVDGDIQLLLDMPAAYTARTVTPTACLHLRAGVFDRLLVEHPAIARRWLTSVAQRTSASQLRLINTLGRPLGEQIAALLHDEARDGQVELSQSILAAMLGVRRPSLNKVLKIMERRGLITIGYRTIAIRNPAGLAKAAGTT